MMKSLFSLAGALLLTTATAHDHQDEEEFVWKVLDTRLPKPLSDLTATLSPDTGLVYIAGGCDSELGNQFIEFEVAEGINQTGFACFSISSNLYSFDPSSETSPIVTLPDLPRPRYRHGAAIVDKYLWLFGGRDGDDNLIPEVDVYDIEAGDWLESPGSLSEELQTSDNAGFSDGASVYSVGGFEVDYTAKTTVFKINGTQTAAPLNETIALVSSLLEARGDVSAVTTSDQSTAYVSGGFTHVNDFCLPLASVEMYTVETDKWSETASLQTPRADKALVALNDRVFAVGGETQIPNKCTINPDDLPIAGEQTLAVDDVEVLEATSWRVLASLPNHRFRFAAIGWGPTETVYTFGGQVAYDNECQCFKTTNEIVSYKEEIHDDGDSPSQDDNDSSCVKLHQSTLLFSVSFVAALVVMG